MINEMIWVIYEQGSKKINDNNIVFLTEIKNVSCFLFTILIGDLIFIQEFVINEVMFIIHELGSKKNKR